MRFIIYVIIYLIVASIFSSSVYAYGAFLTNGLPQVAIAEIKMAVIYDGTQETIVASDTFNINPLVVNNFLWLMPVAKRPEVTVLRDSVFTGLDKLSLKKFNKNSWWKQILYVDIDEEDHLPAETFSHTAYVKNPIVFSSSNGEAFQKWLSQKGDFIPKNGIALYKRYIKNGWYFAGVEVDAVHMEYDATDSLLMSGAHTLPVAVRFPFKDTIIPLQFSIIQPDRDSTAVPLSFPYGSLSENVLGARDERVDDLLATPSSNRYPPLPQDFSHIKIELYVFNDHKMDADGFTTVYADWIDGKTYSLKDPKGIDTFPILKKKMFLTRMYSYIPLSQLDDIKLKDASRNKRVNPNLSTYDTFIRVIIVIFIVLLLIKYKKRTSSV